MRAKFIVTGVRENFTELADGSKSKYGEDLSFAAVSEAPYNPDGESEDNSFARWTPSGSLTMTVNNPALWGKLKVGQKFYLDFTEATA